MREPHAQDRRSDRFDLRYPPELQQKYGIDILPFVITLDGVSYTERQGF